MNSQIPRVSLNHGGSMPQFGLGVWQMTDAQVPAAVAAAFDAGYRSVDTAAIYGNEASVGQAIRASGLARADLHITTKLWNDSQGYDNALRAFDQSMQRLGLETLDLYLIHWPLPKVGRYIDSWKALVELQRGGRVRAIGVSNFGHAQIKRLIDETGVVPAVNQIELHPFLQQKELRAFHASHGIVTQAWSPLAQAQALKHTVLTKLAAKHGRTPAQVVLRWHFESGIAAIPKSATPARVRENLQIFDFKLDAQDHAAIAALDAHRRIGPDPDKFHMGA